MKELFLDLMIFTGSALMAYNIYGYVCFSRDVRKHGNWDQMQRLFNLPILLLILFFIGYLVVGIFGKPDLVMAGILFGGSIFVFVMLLLIRRTFDMMGGDIAVQTEKGKGTEFIITVELPLAEPEEEICFAEEEEITFDGKRALLVEDNMINMEIAQMLLEQSGFLVETAENGEIALEMTAASGPGYYDVILMDIQMPVMDGYMATQAIRNLPDPGLAGIPIIAMKANAFQEDIKKAEEAGMNGHIAKPLDIPSMKVTLQHLLKNA